MHSGGRLAWLSLQVIPLHVPEPKRAAFLMTICQMSDVHYFRILAWVRCMTLHAAETLVQISTPVRCFACSVCGRGAAADAASLQPAICAVARLQSRGRCWPVDHGQAAHVSRPHLPLCGAALLIPQPRGDLGSLGYCHLPDR